MIGALLDILRIQDGRLTIQPDIHNLAALLKRVVIEMRSSTTAHQFTLGLPETPLMIFADPLRIEQVFHNLLGNAVKYSPAGGMIEVGAEVDAGAVQVHIRDQGIGIPASALSQVFMRFYRAPNATAQSTSSLGVGLYIVRELVQAHGGTISVESAEGEGSTFVVRLPLLNLPASNIPS
jgi:signal transduction histidine kinase